MSPRALPIFALCLTSLPILLTCQLPAQDLLAPRKPLPKSEVFLPEGKSFHILVKFSDAARARLDENGQLNLMLGETEEDLISLFEDGGFSLKPLFAEAAARQLDALAGRAAKLTGFAQPDMRGMFVVEPSDQAAKNVLALAKRFNVLQAVELVFIEAADRPLDPPPADFAPATGNFVGRQGYRGPDPGIDIDYAWLCNALGQGVRISDCEYFYRSDHEDLVDAGIVNRSRGPYDNSNPPGWLEHGTAVLGILGAPDNGYGITGLVPESDLEFHSEDHTGPDPGSLSKRQQAILDALANSDPGDVVLLEMQRTLSGDGGGLAPAETDPVVFLITALGTGSGVIVVAAAGNENVDLDGANPAVATWRGWGDSGAIIVGSGSSTVAHDKRPSSSFGSRVDVHAWGTNILTTGYGSLVGDPELGGDARQRYRRSFGGTSGASALVAGACGSIQSFAIALVHRNALSPNEMRTLLRTTGIPQGAGGNVGPFINVRAAIERLVTLRPVIPGHSGFHRYRQAFVTLPRPSEGWLFKA